MFYRNSLDPALVCEVLTLARCVQLSVWPRQTLLKWAVIIIHRSPGHTQHIHQYTNTLSSPLCSRQRSPPPPSQYQTLSISRLWKLYFVPSASRDHFWQHLRLKLRLKVKTKKEDVKIWKSIIEETSFCNWMLIRDQQRYLLVPNTKHSTVKLYKLDNVGRISCYGMRLSFPARTK